MPQPKEKSLLEERAAEKRAARKEDLARLESGVSAELLQRENSIFPKSFFANARISNLKQAVGQ
jgi:hypothetical protein